VFFESEYSVSVNNIDRQTVHYGKSTLSGLQFRRWQYGYIFNRLTAVAPKSSKLYTYTRFRYKFCVHADIKFRIVAANVAYAPERHVYW